MTETLVNFFDNATTLFAMFFETCITIGQCMLLPLEDVVARLNISGNVFAQAFSDVLDALLVVFPFDEIPLAVFLFGIGLIVTLVVGLVKYFIPFW